MLIRSGIFLSCALITVAASHAQTYTVESVGLLPGFPRSHAVDINESGTVLATALDGIIGQSYLYKDGNISPLPLSPGYAYSIGNKLNATGEVAGCRVLLVPSHGLFPQAATFNGSNVNAPYPPYVANGTILPETSQFVCINDAGMAGGLAGSNAALLRINNQTYRLADTTGTFWWSGIFAGQVHGINNKGEVLVQTINRDFYKLSGGWTVIQGGPQASLKLYRAGTTQKLGSPSADVLWANAAAFNDHGQFVGSFSTSNKSAFFLYSENSFSEVPPLDGKQRIAIYDINNHGQIVGWSDDRAFLRVGSITADLNDLTPSVSPSAINGFTELVAAYSINDAGRIVGVGRWKDANGEISWRGFILKPASLGKPVISPNGGSFVGYAMVSLTSIISGGTIYYSLNGGPPTTPYAKPFVVTNSCVLRAVSTKPSFPASEVATATFTISPPTEAVQAPTITPNGGTHRDSVYVQINSSTPDSSLRITTDGSDPRAYSPWIRKSAYVQITNNCSIRAVTSKPGFLDAETKSAPYTILVTPVLPSPTVEPMGGDFTGSVTVSMSTTATNGRIRFSADGSSPSTIYTAPFTLNRPTTVRAIVEPASYDPLAPVKSSPETVAIFTSTAANTPPVTILPAGGTFESSQLVSFKVKGNKTPVFYTIDGSEPTATSLRYVAPFFLTNSGTVRSRAIMDGFNHGDIATAVFDISASSGKVATPTLSLPSGTYAGNASVKIRCATPKVSIRYTLDGSIPSGNSPETKGAVRVANSGTLTVRAFKNGSVPSDPVSAIYNIVSKKK